MEDNSSSDDERTYPISLRYHRNRYAGILYDVEGRVLTGMTGEPLNVFKEEMKDMMVEKKIRFIHCLHHEPTYAYFTITTEQQTRFQEERINGSLDRDKVYHVYIDTD